MGPISPSKAHFETLQHYYASLESRIGYRLFLRGTRHFAYYQNENAWPWPIGKALRAMEDHLFDALDLPKDSLVLDAGCGYGHVASRGAERGLRVDCIDIVNRHVVRAQETILARGLGSRVSVRWGDYHDLSPFKDSGFDGIYTMETVVHANDPSKVFAEFFRVLKPGGHLCMHEYEHVPQETVSKEDKRIMRMIDKYSAMPAHSKFVLGGIRKMLEAEGFVDVKVEDISAHTQPLVWLFYIVAIIPYLILSIFGLEHLFINAVAGVQSYRLGKKRILRYMVVTARKPGHLDQVEPQTSAGAVQEGVRKR